MIKCLLTYCTAIYLGAGLFAGTLVGQAIPALNAVGISYIALTWPLAVYCAPVANECDFLPPERLGKYMFSTEFYQEPADGQ